MAKNDDKRKRPDPLTLAPLSFEEALEAMLQVPPPPKGNGEPDAHDEDHKDAKKDK